MMNSLTITLPDGITESEARLLLAIKLYEQGRISSGKGAEIAGYSRRTFMELLGKQGTAVFNSSPNELADDLSHA